MDGYRRRDRGESVVSGGDAGGQAVKRRSCGGGDGGGRGGGGNWFVNGGTVVSYSQSHVGHGGLRCYRAFLQAKSKRLFGPHLHDYK